MWVAIENQWGDGWEVVYQVVDCKGTKGAINMIAEPLDEQEARLIAQRLNA